jgi:Ni,Fe-hydrogenase maturation factor
MEHLVQDHKMDKETGELRAFNKGPLPEFKVAKELHFAANFESFKALLLRWLVYSHIAFVQIENVYFRQMLAFLSPGIERFFPKARDTIRGWVLRLGSQEKMYLLTNSGLRTAQSRSRLTSGRREWACSSWSM